MTIDERLAELGVELPKPPAPAGLYSPSLQTGNYLYISGQVPLSEGKPMARGKCGAEVSVEEGAGLARACTLNALAIARQHLGSLDRISKVVRVGGYVASTPDFEDHPKVINGASELLMDVFGETGTHARIAIGVAALPRGVPVEVEFTFEIDG
ncbi:MAG: RidA family protein [Dehalococcoidia bacterium]|nr:RidA family protein [Dehalococcoidia bacterium]